ncbi:MAG: hypothetical protein J6B94_08395 [Lachnospiraceae bacterium]|nr:hypothetical protein [Lachnospiraceae bacterium]
MEYESIQMENGKIFSGKRIGELVENIINKFSEENLTCNEGKIVLAKAIEVIGGYSKIQKID